jgi:hypothetical protein
MNSTLKEYAHRSSAQKDLFPMILETARKSANSVWNSTPEDPVWSVFPDMEFQQTEHVFNTRDQAPAQPDNIWASITNATNSSRTARLSTPSEESVQSASLGSSCFTLENVSSRPTVQPDNSSSTTSVTTSVQHVETSTPRLESAPHASVLNSNSISASVSKPQHVAPENGLMRLETVKLSMPCATPSTHPMGSVLRVSEISTFSMESAASPDRSPRMECAQLPLTLRLL